jgi:hypothetical protein
MTMRVWTIFWIFVVALLATFAFANWQLLSAPTTISLVVADVRVPLGLTLLGALVALGLLFLLFLVWLETKALLELGALRRSSAAGAGPPAGELHVELARELSGLRRETSELTRTMIARLDGLEQVVKEDLERTSQTITSFLRRAS